MTIDYNAMTTNAVDIQVEALDIRIKLLSQTGDDLENWLYFQRITFLAKLPRNLRALIDEHKLDFGPMVDAAIAEGVIKLRAERDKALAVLDERQNGRKPIIEDQRVISISPALRERFARFKRLGGAQ
jgi:hypothetical protein